jgi:hypothetical protein
VSTGGDEPMAGVRGAQRQFVVEHRRGTVRESTTTSVGTVRAAKARAALDKLVGKAERAWPVQHGATDLFVEIYHPMCAVSDRVENYRARPAEITEDVALEVVARYLKERGIDTDAVGPLAAALDDGVWRVGAARPDAGGVSREVRVSTKDGSLVFE